MFSLSARAQHSRPQYFFRFALLGYVSVALPQTWQFTVIIEPLPYERIYLARETVFQTQDWFKDLVENEVGAEAADCSLRLERTVFPVPFGPISVSTLRRWLSESCPFAHVPAHWFVANPTPINIQRPRAPLEHVLGDGVFG